jgi:hypothetical protein
MKFGTVLGTTNGVTEKGQSYICEAQMELTPWLISVAGFRWHNWVSHKYMQ